MLELFRIPLASVLSVYAIMAAGMLCRKGGWITKESSDSVLKLVVNLLSPCLIASKILSNEVFGDPRNLYLPPLTGFLEVAVGIAVAALCCLCVPTRLSGLTTKRAVCTFTVCVGMLNYGYVPIPLIQDLFPNDDRMLAVLFMQNMGTEFALWTLCIFVFMGRFTKEAFWRVVNIPTLSIVACVVLNMTGLDRYIPRGVMKPVAMLGQSMIPISLLFVGAIIAENVDRKQIVEDAGLYLRLGIMSSVLRLFVLPAMIILTAKYLPCTYELKVVLVIHGAMASAIFPIVLARLYDGSVKTAMATVLGNTLLALVTTPIWIAVGLRVIA